MDALGGDRSYCSVHARSRPQDVLGWPATSGGKDNHSKEDCSVPERLGTTNAGSGVLATRSRRFGRARRRDWEGAATIFSLLGKVGVLGTVVNSGLTPPL